MFSAIYRENAALSVKLRALVEQPPTGTWSNRNGASPRAAGLEEEPRAPLGLVDPGLEQACAGYVSLLVAKDVRLPQVGRQPLVVVAQFREHVQGRDEIRVVVQNSLQAADLTDRAHRRPTDLSNALGDCVNGGEDLLP